MKIPKKSNLKSRISTINNSFVVSITPWANSVNKEELKWLLESLKLEEGQCAYCLAFSISSDHFYPLVENKMPKGYVTELYNLVPACSSCNSSKGGKNWYD